MRVLLALPCILLTTAIGGEGAPSFAQKPSAKKVGNVVRIGFSASASTDAAVAIIDAKGKVVRHLAAGMLGAKAPAPLKPGLSQSLAWDGKDDRGKPARGGPFKVRVSLGLKPALDGFIGFDPKQHNPMAVAGAQPHDSVRGMATGPGGELFAFRVFGSTNMREGSMECSVFSRQGKYLRTIIPYPASLDENKLKGLKRIELEGGVKVPFIYHGGRQLLFPGTGEGVASHRAIATRDGRVAFLGVQQIYKGNLPTPVRLVVLRGDGSVPGGNPVRAAFEKGAMGGTLAMSPDEKTLYATGFRKRSGPVNTVYRLGWNDKAPVPLIKTGLNGPTSIATDKGGNIYVADKGNGRIAVFKSDGSPLGALKVAKPERVEVHPRTGAVYVLGGERVDQLMKFSSWKNSTPAAKVKVPSFKHRSYSALLALDASAEPPVLWVSTQKRYYAGFSLLRLEDRGASFGDQTDLGKVPARSPRYTAGQVTNLSCARDRGILNIGPHFYDLKQRKDLPVERAAVNMLSPPSSRAGSFGLDGNFLFQVGHATIRLGPDLKIRPFPKGVCDAAKIAQEQGNAGIKGYGSLDKHGGIGSLGGSAACRGRGATVDLHGRPFIISGKNWGKPYGAAVSSYAADGSVLKAKLIDTDIRGITSVRVDPKGNVYVALSLRPGKDLIPPGLKGKLPGSAKDPDGVGGINWYPLIYGSVAKFGPEGGLVRKDAAGVECNYGFRGATSVKGAKWIQPGITSALSFRTPGAPGNCTCDSPRFDVDGFGRSFFADAGRFRVWVLDTGGNKIGWFGSYGNVDSGGPGSEIPKPDIPLAWPQAVAVENSGTVYVGDRINRRVVKVKLNCAAEETCDVK